MESQPRSWITCPCTPRPLVPPSRTGRRSEGWISAAPRSSAVAAGRPRGDVLPLLGDGLNGEIRLQGPRVRVEHELGVGVGEPQSGRRAAPPDELVAELRRIER